MNIIPLAPKMTLQYAERAKKGDWHYHLEPSIYIWHVGNHEICIFGLNNPTGHIQKYTTREMENKKRELAANGHPSRVST